MVDQRIIDLNNLTLNSELSLVLDGTITGKTTLGDITEFVRSSILEDTTSDVGIVVYGKPADTTNWLLYDGGVYNKSDYPELIALWDSLYGLDGSSLQNNWYVGTDSNTPKTTFRTPDLKAKGEHLRAVSSLYNYNAGDFITDATQRFFGSVIFRNQQNDFINIYEANGIFRAEGVTCRVAVTGSSAININPTRLVIDNQNAGVRTSDETRVNAFVEFGVWVKARSQISITPPVPPSPYEAIDVNYDNSTSGLVASEVQNALDETNSKIESLPIRIREKYEKSEQNPNGIVIGTTLVELGSLLSIQDNIFYDATNLVFTPLDYDTTLRFKFTFTGNFAGGGGQAIELYTQIGTNAPQIYSVVRSDGDQIGYTVTGIIEVDQGGGAVTNGINFSVLSVDDSLTLSSYVFTIAQEKIN